MESAAQGTIWKPEYDSYSFYAMGAGRFFVALWRAGLAEYDEMEGIAWSWQSIDDTLTKVPRAQGTVGRNPTGGKEPKGIYWWAAVVFRYHSS